MKIFGFLIKAKNLNKIRKVYIAVEQPFSASSTTRGYQISRQLRKEGVNAQVLDLHAESKRDYQLAKMIKDSIVIFIKRAFLGNHNLPCILKEKNNIIIWDPLDTLMQFKNEQNIKLFDGVIVSNSRCEKDARLYFKDGCSFLVIHHHWDPRCKPNKAKGYNLVFVGDPTSENIDKEFINSIKELNIEQCSNIKAVSENGLFKKMLGYNCHFSVRREASGSFNYKPNVKLVFASACHANIILSQDISNIEILDSSYPYYTSSNLKSVLDAVRYSKETYLTDTWHRALDMIKEIREKTSLKMVCKNYIQYLKRF